MRQKEIVNGALKKVQGVIAYKETMNLNAVGPSLIKARFVEMFYEIRVSLF